VPIDRSCKLLDIQIQEGLNAPLVFFVLTQFYKKVWPPVSTLAPAITKNSGSLFSLSRFRVRKGTQPDQGHGDDSPMKNNIVLAVAASNMDKIVGETKGIGGAVSAPIFGYEIQFEGQQKAELAVKILKANYFKTMKELGIQVTSPNASVVFRANKKIRRSKKEKLKGLHGSKMDAIKSLKASIKEAKKTLSLVTDSVVASLYNDDIKKWEQEISQLSA